VELAAKHDRCAWIFGNRLPCHIQHARDDLVIVVKKNKVVTVSNADSYVTLHSAIAARWQG
jgi:hypothetical protein